MNPEINLDPLRHDPALVAKIMRDARRARAEYFARMVKRLFAGRREPSVHGTPAAA